MASAAANIPKFLGSVYPTVPDNDEPKEVYVEAVGLDKSLGTERHVTLSWTNSAPEASVLVTQVVHLTGNPGNYNFYHPVAKPRRLESVVNNKRYILGKMSRAQRDAIGEHAKAIPFSKKSIVNNCQVWMRKLLVGMLEDGLITKETFAEIDADVPLQKPKEEAEKKEKDDEEK